MAPTRGSAALDGGGGSGVVQGSDDGAHPTAPAVDTWVTSWAARIRPHMAKAVEGILAAGGELLAARAEAPHGSWGRLLEEIGIGERMAQRFMRVAAHPVLSDPSRVTALPPAIGVLDELTRLDDDTLAVAIESGEVGPSTTRQQAERLTREQRNPRARGRDAEIEESALEIAELAASTDAGVHGPPIQVRDSQLDQAHLLAAATLENGTDLDLLVALAGLQRWSRHESWVTFCSWLLTIDHPALDRPWTDQLVGGHEDLVSAAREYVTGNQWAAAS